MLNSAIRRLGACSGRRPLMCKTDSRSRSDPSAIICATYWRHATSGAVRIWIPTLIRLGSWRAHVCLPVEWLDVFTSYRESDDSAEFLAFFVCSRFLILNSRPQLCGFDCYNIRYDTNVNQKNYNYNHRRSQSSGDGVM